MEALMIAPHLTSFSRTFESDVCQISYLTSVEGREFSKFSSF